MAVRILSVMVVALFDWLGECVEPDNCRYLERGRSLVFARLSFPPAGNYTRSTGSRVVEFGGVDIGTDGLRYCHLVYKQDRILLPVLWFVGIWE